MSDTATKMEFEQFDWSRKTVLLVEDVDANHIFIASALKRTGVNIILAKDGREAIDLVRETPGVDLVLMDIRLPELDGYEATRQIKSLNPRIPVVAQTDYVMINEKGKMLQQGCNDLIVKPLQLRALLFVCARYLGS